MGKIKEVSDKIAKEYQPERIILFGSFAWGNPTEDSDADLFIVKNDVENPLEAIREVNRIIYKRDIPVDILVYTQDQAKKREEMGDPLVREILMKGKVLYSK